MGGKTHAFAGAFDASYAVRHDLEHILKQNIPLFIVTDSGYLFKVIFQSLTMTEKSLMIYIQAGHKAYQERKIDNMGWIPSEANLADGSLKRTGETYFKKSFRQEDSNSWPISGLFVLP